MPSRVRHPGARTAATLDLDSRGMALAGALGVTWLAANGLLTRVMRAINGCAGGGRVVVRRGSAGERRLVLVCALRFARRSDLPCTHVCEHQACECVFAPHGHRSNSHGAQDAQVWA